MIGTPKTLARMMGGAKLCDKFNKGTCAKKGDKCDDGIHKCNGQLPGGAANRACNGRHPSIECDLCMQVD